MPVSGPVSSSTYLEAPLSLSEEKAPCMCLAGMLYGRYLIGNLLMPTFTKMSAQGGLGWGYTRLALDTSLR